ncbi:MAG: lamin tail domain-containing protein, partial [Chlorobi bacterium]|nr:lamin tail domain-containing protein [Chlorobiota bacterium]
EGGWSLEKIDPLNNCSTSANWIASVDTTGGTPGRKNSVFASNIDNTKPQLTSVEIITISQLQLVFSEIMDTSEALNVANYTVNNGIGNPDSVSFSDAGFLTFSLYFSTAFPDEDTSYLTISNIVDLCGNTIADTSAEFIFYIVKPNDVVINEIMADPSPVVGLPDYEFIEFYNTTIYDISLKQWKLSVGSSTVSLPDIICPADSFFILASSSGYHAFDTMALAYPVTSFPSLSNGGASITLSDSAQTIISSVSYSD